MPYRRLPNTDIKRLKAIRTIISASEDLPTFKLPFSFKSLQQVKTILPNFEREIILQKEALKHQVERQKEYSQAIKKARLYISHFIQVMNMAITRGDLPSSALKFYGLKSNKLPSMSNENSLIRVSKKIIEGERERTLNGGNPITNPTIALVNVRFEKFLELNQHQKVIKENYIRASNNVANFRPEIDKLIQAIWNEIEGFFSNLPDDGKREMSSRFGVEYVFRKSELAHDTEEITPKIIEEEKDKKINDNPVQYSISF